MFISAIQQCESTVSIHIFPPSWNSHPPPTSHPLCHHRALGWDQFSSVQSLSHVQLFAISWTAACQVSLSITKSWSLLKLMSIESGCHPSISYSVIPFSCLQSWPASGSFPLVSYLHQLAKYWSFNFTISSSNEYSGLISFNIDWLDIFAVQGTLPWCFSSKASNFSAQLSLYSKSHIHIWL